MSTRAKAKERLAHLRSLAIWNTILLTSVIFAAFVLPVLPDTWQRGLFRLSYTAIYISAVLSLDKRSKYVIMLFILTFLMEWITSLIGMPVLEAISKVVNVVFFLVVMMALIFQIAMSREVNLSVILGSVAGYLLMGLIFSIFISIILRVDPGAYNYAQPTKELDAGIPMYYGYITMTTVGYGDIVPLKPYTRSLATLIAVSGQLYIAIIVALLVGKFAVTRGEKEG